MNSAKYHDSLRNIVIKEINNKELNDINQFLHLEELKNIDQSTYDLIKDIQDKEKYLQEHEIDKHKINMENIKDNEYDNNKINIKSLLDLLDITKDKIYDGIFTFAKKYNYIIKDKILINLEQFINNDLYLPYNIIEKIIAFLQNEIIIIIDTKQHVNVYYPNGNIESFTTIYSNILCGIIEQNIPKIFIYNDNKYLEYTYKEYIQNRVCKICMDDNNHNTHIINPCRHTMCKLCIIKCFENKSTCPICRTMKKSITTIDDEDTISTNLQEYGIKRKNIVNRMF